MDRHKTPQNDTFSSRLLHADSRRRWRRALLFPASPPRLQRLQPFNRASRESPNQCSRLGSEKADSVDARAIRQVCQIFLTQFWLFPLSGPPQSTALPACRILLTRSRPVRAPSVPLSNSAPSLRVPRPSSGQNGAGRSRKECVQPGFLAQRLESPKRIEL